MSSPGSMTMASFVCSSPITEQLHCSGPTGKISWIMVPNYHEAGWGFTRRASTAGLFLPQHDSLDRCCPAGRGIAIDQGGAQAHVVRRRLEAGRHISQKASEDLFLLHADDAVVGAGHSHVGLHD